MGIYGKAYHGFKVKSIQGRYVNPEQLAAFLENLPAHVGLSTIGKSVQDREIFQIKMGSGDIKVLMWSQMHGNETTTTKGVLDLITHCLNKGQKLLDNITLIVIPMLNPDGAQAYTRENANGVDLNRDAVRLSQPESLALRTVYDSERPHFCFNLHDQRTIYNVGNSALPATLSFLAPAVDHQKSVPLQRKMAMQLIAAMVGVISKKLSGQIGRYSDSYNNHCVGDTFMSKGTPTILFEAGHFQEDFEREITRMHVFNALLSALRIISKRNYNQYSHEDYFKILENEKNFRDIIVRNAHLLYHPKEAPYSVALQMEEVLSENNIKFIPNLSEKGNLDRYFGHLTLDASLPSHRDKLMELPEILDLLS